MSTDGFSPLALYKLLVAFLILFTTLSGCSQYHHLVPPPPPTTPENWKSSFTLSFTHVPGSRVPVAMQIGTYFKVEENHVLGFGINGFSLPNSFSYVGYHQLEHDLYMNWQVHLSQLYWLGGEGGYTPGIEVDAGLMARHNNFRHSAHVGIAWMPDISGSWSNRWNLFSSSPRSGFIPTFGYTGFHGQFAFTGSWYPGMKRFLLSSYRKPLNTSDTGFVFVQSDSGLQRLPTDSTLATSYNRQDRAGADIPFTMVVSDTLQLRINKIKAMALAPFLLPIREVSVLKDLSGMDRKRNYYWVTLSKRDSYIGHDFSRIMALDTGIIMRRYRETGVLEIKDDPAALRWLEEVSIPVWHDMLFSVGYWQRKTW